MTHPFAASYDDVPYPGLPEPRSQCDYLATVGRLRGLATRDPRAARVLELGCATGQNLLPLAERYPRATFIGIDKSARQIDAARQAARALQLNNIEFLAADLLALDASFGKFDYIIAHGVYSWVAPEARDHLLRLCHDCLAADGVAYVSYNTWPGWHVHAMLRALMQYEARDAGTASEQVAGARRVLDFLSGSLTEDRPYEALVRPAVAALARQADGYLLHDHLEAINQPVYYGQAIAHAMRHGLQPIGDGVLGFASREELSSNLEERLRAITTDPARQEEYRDVIRNRAIRQTLLAHSQRPLTEPSAESLSGMHLAANLKPESGAVDLASNTSERFVTPAGARIATAVPVVKAALAHLGTLWPNFIAYEDLVAVASRQIEALEAISAAQAAKDLTRLGANLWQACAAGIVEPHVEPQSFLAQVSVRPLASPLARWQAVQSPIATNRKHESLSLDELSRQVVGLLDGTRDLSQLADHLASLTVEGRLTLTVAGQAVTDRQQARDMFEQALPTTLATLARGCLLIG